MIQCCLQAGAQCTCIPIVTDKAIAGWNDHVKQAREQSLRWHFTWQQAGRLNHGHIYQIMKTTLQRQHYSVLYNSVLTSDSDATLYMITITCDESLAYRVTRGIMALSISKLKIWQERWK